MFSIKLVHWHYFCLNPFSDDYTDGRKTLMNFNRKSKKRYADKICCGDKAIVYVTKPDEKDLEDTPQCAVWSQKFVRAIEYIGTVKDGEVAARAYGDQIDLCVTKPWRVFLPIRNLAKVDPAETPDFQVVLKNAGVIFEPQHVPMVEISKEEYDGLYEAIKWQWKA